MARTPTDPTKAQVWITKGLDELDFEFYFPQGPKGDPGGITLGTDLLQNDLNTIKTSGVYRQASPTDATQLKNYPPMTTIAGGILLVHQRDATGTVVYQSYQPTSGSYDVRVEWRRLFNAGGWSAWRAYSANRTDQTVGRQVFLWDEINNRDQMIYGDTGQLDIRTAYLNGTASSLMLRRAGSLVTLTCVGWVPPANAAGNVLLSALPVGWRNYNSLAFAALENGSTLKAGSMGANTSSIAIGGNVTTGSYNFHLSYLTADAWPTALIGTQVTPPAI